MKLILSLLFLVVTSSVWAAGPVVINPTNVGVFETDSPGNYSRVVALSDIRGSFQSFANLLLTTGLVNGNAQWMGAKTLVVITGNIIGTGNGNINLIEFIMNLKTQAEIAGGNIVCLLGEEEARLLADPDAYKNDSLRAELAARHLNMGMLINPMTNEGKFFRGMPLAARVGKWVFMHSGLYPEVIWPQFKIGALRILQMGNYGDPFLLGKDTVLTANDWWKDPKAVAGLEQRLMMNGFSGVVFGHQNKALNMPGEVAIADQGRLVKVDSGMGPSEGASPGRLLVFMSPVQMSVMGPAKMASMAPGGVLRPLNY